MKILSLLLISLSLMSSPVNSQADTNICEDDCEGKDINCQVKCQKDVISCVKHCEDDIKDSEALSICVEKCSRQRD